MKILKISVHIYYNFEIFSCAESFDLSKFGIKHGKCIDEKLLNELFNLKLNFKKDRNQREECYWDLQYLYSWM